MFSLIKSPYGKLFFTVQSLEKENLITPTEKGLLKDLIINESEKISPILKSLSTNEFNNNVDSFEINEKEVSNFLLTLIKEQQKPEKSQENNEIITNNAVNLIRNNSKNTILKPNSQSFTETKRKKSKIIEETSKNFSTFSNFKQNTRGNIRDSSYMYALNDDSIIEYSPNSKKHEEIQMRKNYSMYSSSHNSQSMNSSIIQSSVINSNNENEEESLEEGTFRDYYKNFKEEFNLPSLHELSRIDSSQVFMARSSVKMK